LINPVSLMVNILSAEQRLQRRPPPLLLEPLENSIRMVSEEPLQAEERYQPHQRQRSEHHCKPVEHGHEAKPWITERAAGPRG
jgi:hypothetical protein